MKNKFLSLLFVMVTAFASLMFSATSAFAKTVDLWADDSFNFKSVRAVKFDSVDFTSSGITNPDDLVYNQMVASNRSSAEKMKFYVIPENEEMSEDAINFRVSIERWDSSEQWHEPYTTMEKRKGTREIKDNRGMKITETYYYEVPVEHPGYYTYWSHVQVRYDGYSKDDKLVYTHRESRNREESKAHIKMYDRITKDFIARFAKKLK